MDLKLHISPPNKLVVHNGFFCKKKKEGSFVLLDHSLLHADKQNKSPPLPQFWIFFQTETKSKKKIGTLCGSHNTSKKK